MEPSPSPPPPPQYAITNTAFAPPPAAASAPFPSPSVLSSSSVPAATSSSSSSPTPTFPPPSAVAPMDLAAPAAPSTTTIIPRPPSYPYPPVDAVTNRVQTIVEKPFVYGTAAFWLGKQTAENAHSHRWTVFLRGLENEDLSYFISSVTFGLHSSFINPNRVLTSPPYEVTETGWGEFVITITVAFTHPALQPVSLSHLLKLFPPPTIQPTVRKPVMSETYDELVFFQPERSVYDVLMSGPLQRFDSHPFSAWWTTKEFAREEQQQIVKLAGVLETVKERLIKERHRLWRVEQDISQITGRMTG